MMKNKRKMNNKPKIKKIVFITGAVIILSAVMVFAYMNSGTVADIEEVKTGELAQLVKDNGVVEAEGTITLTAKVSMEITKVYAKEGDFVNKGNIILSHNDTTANLDIHVLQAQAAGEAVVAGLNIVGISRRESVHITLNVGPEDAMKPKIGSPVARRQNEIILS